MAMTRAEFKARWDSDDDGGGISGDDVAECAIAWGITSQPRIRPMADVLSQVLDAAGVGEEGVRSDGD